MKDLSLHILDIVQNSLHAGATRVDISITEDVVKNIFEITIKDNGSGIDPGNSEKVTDPFYTTGTKKKVGLGLALLKQNAEAAGGFLKIENSFPRGVKVTARFQHNHIDRQPLGKIEETIKILMTAINLRLIYSHEYNGKIFVLDTLEIEDALETKNLSNPKIVKYITEMIIENLTDIGAY
ncbi:MAG: ATP-binding protein [Bacteroidales bacterium]|nr:ATP-binding protein [Bacteroidales bacterium]